MAAETPEDTQNTQESDSWHVIKQTDGHCEIFSQAELAQRGDSPQMWGPFVSRAEAIAKRVGLIRAGKCLPK
ncbi:DDE transposase family protein [Adonisia turfae]|uniref:DDE transposase family protein n=1 Tax=Adonisia turfae CCMR0081 TaxID=2292702 RepID=A0A6M0RKP0_9CYAN|nr:DDE transposase family protein [Adonisia turfae]NEZ56450.1 DDE transposase family protein [Adonisia turfae CCMR0081]